MTTPPPDGSRDRRIEDPSNRFLIHPVAQALVPWAIRARVSANAVSVAGLILGLGAAALFAHWPAPAAVLAGVALAIGTAQGWALAVAAGAAHAIQSSLYEGERYRYHRRLRGEPLPAALPPSRNPLVAGYDRLAGSVDRVARPFEAALAAAPDPRRFGAAYARAAAAPMRCMIPLSANTRVGAVAIACLLAQPTLFWWFELTALSAVTAIGLAWHRRVELRFTSRRPASSGGRPHLTA